MRPRPPLLLIPVALLGLAAPTLWRLGEARDGRRLLATGQTLSLDATAIPLPARGLDLVLSPDGASAYAKTTRGAVRIDLTTGRTAAEWRSRAGASMVGVALADAGLLVTDAAESLAILDPMTMAPRRTVKLGAAKVGGPCYPCGVAAAGGRAFVALNRDDAVAIVDLADGTFRKVPVGVAPYGATVAGDRVFVTCWGRPPAQGKPHAPSAGVEVETDERGAAAGGAVVELDLDGRELRRWSVGAQPTEVAVAADALYVACANADAVVRIARADGTTRTTRLDGLPGAAPSSLLLDGERLWVALSGENRVLALDLKTGRSLGSLETGWYPVAVRRGRNGLVVADAKGEGAPTRGVGEIVGAVRRLDPAKLAPAPKTADPKTAVPEVAVAKAKRPPVRRAVYIIKENRTYDQVFGDLPQGKGDPSLAMYGREVTPNHHALAEEFLLLDDFADNGSISTDGHAWAIEGQATAFYERSFGGWTRAYPFGGDEPLAVSRGGHLWDAALAKGKTFRNYGEFMYANDAPGFKANFATWKAGGTIPFKSAIGVKRVVPYTAPGFPGWNMAIPDGYRADAFLREFAEMERTGKMPDLVTIYLPQDHTSGDAPGAPTPRAHVADNDLAVGRIVEAISRSRFWKDTAIFALEDDPQAGLDSVDGHRSLCLVASPYTRRGTVVSAFYNQTSVLRTICEILGVKPYTRFIAESPSMSDLFVGRPDLTPYAARPARIPLDELNPPKRNAARLDLTGPDATDEETMDHLLWSMAYPRRPYPHRKDE